MPNFTASKTVTELVSGRQRNDEFDAAVLAAWNVRSTDAPVLEELVADMATAQDYRKGLDRSAKYVAKEHDLPVRIALQIEELTEGKNAGKVWVRFSAVEKRRSPRAGANGTDENDNDSNLVDDAAPADAK